MAAPKIVTTIVFKIVSKIVAEPWEFCVPPWTPALAHLGAATRGKRAPLVATIAPATALPGRTPATQERPKFSEQKVGPKIVYTHVAKLVSKIAPQRVPKTVSKTVAKIVSKLVSETVAKIVSANLEIVSSPPFLARSPKKLAQQL